MAVDPLKLHRWRRETAGAHSSKPLPDDDDEPGFVFPSEPDVVASFVEAARAAALRYREGRDVRPLVVEVEAVAAALVSRPVAQGGPVAALVDRWCDGEGPRFALRALLRAGELDAIAWRTDAAFRKLVPHWDFHAGYVGPWRRLRERLLSAPDGEYVSARDEAAHARRSVSTPSARAAIAYAFPLEPAWAREEAQRAPPNDGLVPAYRCALLASLDDLESIQRLVSEFPIQSMTYLPTVVDRIGADCVPWLIELGRAAPTALRLDVLEAARSLSGRALADAAAGLALDPSSGALAFELLSSVPEDALASLAARASQPRAERALAMLRRIAASNPGLPALVARSLDARAAAVLTPWIEESWLLPRPKRRSRAGWLNPAAFGPVRDAKGHLLDGLDLGEMSMALERGDLASRPESPAALAAVAAALTEQWAAAGAPSSGAWVLRALAATGSSDAARSLATLARRWSHERHERAALVATRALASMGGMEPLVALSRLDALGGDVGAQVAEDLRRGLASSGWTTADLEDAAVQDFGLIEEPWLDFGPRRFRVIFDERTAPKLLDETGAGLPSLPRANRRDDPLLVARARRRWDDIRNHAGEIEELGAARLEAAMCDRRSFARERFLASIVAHPILGALARRLVWADESGRTFRIDEEGGFVDARSVQIVVGQRVIVPHPIAMAREGVVGWSKVLDSFHIVQPFQQLDRAIHRMTPATMSSFDDCEIDARDIRALEGHGWEWISSTLHRRIGGTTVVAFLEHVALSTWRIKHVSVDPTVDTLDPLAQSEIVEQLERLRRVKK